jgi:hypothetical protein
VSQSHRCPGENPLFQRCMLIDMQNNLRNPCLQGSPSKAATEQESAEGAGWSRDTKHHCHHRTHVGPGPTFHQVSLITWLWREETCLWGGQNSLGGLVAEHIFHACQRVKQPHPSDRACHNATSRNVIIPGSNIRLQAATASSLVPSTRLQAVLP